MAQQTAAPTLAAGALLAEIRRYVQEKNHNPTAMEMEAFLPQHTASQIKDKLLLLRSAGHATMDTQKRIVLTATEAEGGPITIRQWTPAEAAAHVARLVAGKRPPREICRPTPAERTPQEVQPKMPRGTPNENRPNDAEILRLAAELKDQGAVNVMKALAARLEIPLGTARKWHYKAKLEASATPQVTADLPDDEDIPWQTTPEPAGAPVLGNVPLVEPPAPADETGKLEVKITAVFDDRRSEDFLTSEERSRRLAERRLAELEAETRDLKSQLVMLSAARSELAAENEQLQAGLKEALRTIEQATMGSVIYQLIGNHAGGRPAVMPMPSDAELTPGDEWPQLTQYANGPQRVTVWHCVDTIALSGGNVVCTLRPGFAATGVV